MRRAGRRATGPTDALEELTIEELLVAIDLVASKKAGVTRVSMSGVAWTWEVAHRTQIYARQRGVAVRLIAESGTGLATLDVAPLPAERAPDHDGGRVPHGEDGQGVDTGLSPEFLIRGRGGRALMPNGLPDPAVGTRQGCTGDGAIG